MHHALAMPCYAIPTGYVYMHPWMLAKLRCRAPHPHHTHVQPVAGQISYYVVHAGAYRYDEVVAAVLQHYVGLPEVVRHGGTKYVPVYYWLEQYALPQYERPAPEFRHQPARMLASVVGAARGVLLALPAPLPAVPGYAAASAGGPPVLTRQSTLTLAQHHQHPSIGPGGHYTVYQISGAGNSPAKGGLGAGAAGTAAAGAYSSGVGALLRAWCLHEAMLCRALGKPLTVLLLPGSAAEWRNRMHLLRELPHAAAAQSGAGGGGGGGNGSSTVAAKAAAGAVDATLARLDLAHAACSVKFDAAFITTEVRDQGDEGRRHSF